jgi:hypothetical protein
MPRRVHRGSPPDNGIPHERWGVRCLWNGSRFHLIPFPRSVWRTRIELIDVKCLNRARSKSIDRLLSRVRLTEYLERVSSRPLRTSAGP